jgi:hypothetical protein
MAQGQAAGTAAALCAKQGCNTRELSYPVLREALVRGGVYLEPVLPADRNNEAAVLGIHKQTFPHKKEDQNAEKQPVAKHISYKRG